MSTENQCPVCQRNQWTNYPAVRQCDNCGHMEAKPDHLARVQVIESQYTDAAQHDSCLRGREKGDE